MPKPLVIIITLIANLFFGGKLPAFMNSGNKPIVDPITEQVSGMTLEEKVRQTFVCSYDGKTLDKALLILKSCGNIIYSKSNTDGLTEKEIFDNNQQIHQQDPLSWIMVDQEGGKVARIKDGSPSPRKMAEDNTVSYWGQQHGRTLKDLGFNVDLAPVADITSNNPVIENRSFADDPAIDGTKATEYLVALQTQGIVGVIKHLPGHGRVDSDTHKKTGSLDYSWEEIKNFDLIPFIDTINNGARIVMIGHIIIPELDKKPASISSIVLDKLRSALPNGNDLIFLTDSLSMSGVGLPQAQAAVAALKAGEDMILLQGIDPKPLYEHIIAAYNNGTLDRTKLDQSITRILRVKRQFTN
ncbi:hypothetical protein A3K29_00310 [Candidatus Collierbacteria bacterium RIFOXYB2_FULL_46_14]|uniref:beta-N-acetylhexosaminidase n=1 Tax=Candidatus Collierbacteria bacterium GW2011_GWA2_46_26 TaxID=1618381 RepID=A0A0G1RUJ9_9BACT|nr:MAG: Glycosyl hydrolase domain protein [Candidatus Collierbacteria bacterium GW2011_GWC2_44_13]KKU33633.1 MAG: Glycosyl hydrolase domain protein [Candidatus Collierbacteria bacterium GW2011_GWA2_46_26]OGD72581.1 MAG: hypothetical protein A3K29_00310 [Candidatus Collierbacteria bacterium RIFOXYB2_FULL_46_14]OGD75623.1 MAG: hypothetical protein A3K43_00310 [Candidatus Collierbacteria bacterium RIFOXYA2_FULL_46_20]OGD76959.1 MAG: hypothetical protein A3K39_00310 [Candidatus Collierbacteria bact